jgi:glycosyltransferase involved in cell wall biosynthesis
MLALVHGYGLTGSGSNLWTREVARALCENGTTFHLCTQESRPEQFDWVSSAIRYDESGPPEVLFERKTPYRGKCIVHRPDLAVLPAYVRPQTASKYVFSILDLDDAAIEDYLERNARVFRHLAEAHGVTGMHVNHVLLLSEAARRAAETTSLRYAVMPHGSAIEYVVRPSETMHAVASGALASADHVFTLNAEIRSRLREVFPALDLAAKQTDVPVGVDTSAFRLVPRGERGQAVDSLAKVIGALDRGQSPERRKHMRDALHDGMSREEYTTLLRETARYDRHLPDVDAEVRLRAVDWRHDETVLYVGRLVQAKGVHTVVAAFPSILAERPDAWLLVGGAGPLREPLEAFLHAVAGGCRLLARNILNWGTPNDGKATEPLVEAAAYLDRLEREGNLDHYFHGGPKLAERVIFTGFMDHDALCHLYACGDVGIFPSVVKEASPMVIPEAAAAGCVPLGTDFAGTADSLRVVGANLPEDVQPLMRLRADPEHTVADAVANTVRLLARGNLPREQLREVATARFDWHEVARRVEGAVG